MMESRIPSPDFENGFYPYPPNKKYTNRPPTMEFSLTELSVLIRILRKISIDDLQLFPEEEPGLLYILQLYTMDVFTEIGDHDGGEELYNSFENEFKYFFVKLEEVKY